MTIDRKIDKADLSWGAIPADERVGDGSAPHSRLYDDIYFAGDGLAETEHVFLNGNDLTTRFQKGSSFAVGELGFGTGLNILSAWRLWDETKRNASSHLHLLSFEKHPLTAEDLLRAAKNWPQLRPYAERLCALYPPFVPGFHQLPLSDDVTLTLWFGDAEEGLSQTKAQIDAWFLDGFAPSKNPAMWSPDICRHMVRLSAPDATVATFTVAGAIRRALSEAGFECKKIKGFGSKREMLRATLRAEANAQQSERPWFDVHPTVAAPHRTKIAIIGAGIAGAALAHALRRYGYAPEIIDKTGPAAGASGNVAGLVMPRLDAGDTPAARFHINAYVHTCLLLQELSTEHPSVFNSCGAILTPTGESEATRQQKILCQSPLPSDWLTSDAHGLTLPQGGVVAPPQFVTALIGDTPVHRKTLSSVERVSDGWRIHFAEPDYAPEDADIIVLASAFNVAKFTPNLSLSGSAGQIDHFSKMQAPPRAIAFGPYAAPAPGGGLVIGATYAPIGIGEEPSYSEEATQTNIAAIQRHRPDVVQGIKADESVPRISVRCTTPDRLPIAGRGPDWAFMESAYAGLRQGRPGDCPPMQYQPGLYYLTGLGSRGLVTAPYCAEMIAADIAAAPWPMETTLAEAIHPARFFIRDLKRRKR